METKNPNDFVLKKLKQLEYDHHHLISPGGHGAGGLALFWKSHIKIDVIYSNVNLIDTIIEFEGKSFFGSSATEHRDNSNGTISLIWP